MRALPTRRRVIPTTLMAFGAVLVVLGSFGFTPLTSADEGNSGEVPVTVDTSSGNTTTTAPVTTTTICEETTTRVPETTTTAKVEVLPSTTIKYRSVTTPTALAVTGSSSVPMVGLGVALFVIGLVMFEIRAVRNR